MITYGRDKIFEQQVLNLTVCTFEEKDGKIKHRFVRDKDNRIMMCRKGEWHYVLDKIKYDQPFVCLKKFKPAVSKADTSYVVIDAWGCTDNGITNPIQFNKEQWVQTLERYEHNWLPNNDPRFLKIIEKLSGKIFTKEHKSELATIINYHVSLLPNLCLPSTISFFNDMLAALED